MTPTDQRAGFRLPWSATPEPAEEAAEAVVEGEAAEAVGDPAAVAEPHADVWPTADQADVSTTASEGSAMTDEPTPSAYGARRPARFLADLLRAMQAAAGESRAATIESFRAEVSQFVEQLNARSAEAASALRDAAEADVAGVREWSKAEIARIRAETEERIVARKEELEQQLEAHAASIEAEVERVHAAMSIFEQEMDAFFAQLTAIDDPAVFAATAENLPEPPSLESAVAQASPVAEPVTTIADEVAEPAEEVAETWPQAAPAEAAWPTSDAAAAPEQPTNGVAPTYETASAYETTPTYEPAPAADAAEESPTDAHVAEAADAYAADEPAAMVDDADAAAAFESRLASLGLAEPAEASDTVTETTGSEQAVPAETAPEPARPAELVDTEVIVVGLVSVASIASFKRQLARLPGVDSVSVSSGAEGEFVFRTSHDPALVLHETVPTMPGFGARVIEAGPGRIQVSARDPEADN